MMTVLVTAHNIGWWVWYIVCFLAVCARLSWSDSAFECMLISSILSCRIVLKVSVCYSGIPVAGLSWQLQRLWNERPLGCRNVETEISRFCTILLRCIFPYLNFKLFFVRCGFAEISSVHWYLYLPSEILFYVANQHLSVLPCDNCWPSVVINNFVISK